MSFPIRSGDRWIFDGVLPKGEHDREAVERLARAIGQVTFGDWEAIGWSIKVVLAGAARVAIEHMDASGYDLTMLDP